jgi:hypothetical protein
MAAPRRRKPRSKIKRATSEERLYDYAKGLKNYRTNRRVVVVRMSELSPEYQQKRYLRAAMDAFRPLMMRFEGILVELSNGDILCGLNGASFADMDAVILKLRMSFRDDAVLKAQEDTGGEDVFCHWYEIERDYDEFLAMARDRHEAARNARSKADAGPEPDKIEADKVISIDAFDDEGADDDAWDSDEVREPMDETAKVGTLADVASGKSATASNKDKYQDPDRDKDQDRDKEQDKGEADDNDDGEDDDPDRPGIRRNIKYIEIAAPIKKHHVRSVSGTDLEKIATAVSAADMTPLIKRESIMLIAKGGPPTPVFADRFVPIPLMQETFLPGVDLLSDRWFMRHLREVVDRRTLGASLDFSDPAAMARGFRMSIETVDSFEFQGFELRTRRLKRNQFIMEFSLQDIVSDIEGFLKARDTLEKKDYRVCIGDMDPYTFTLLDRSNLKVDFEKVRYSSSFVGQAGKTWQKAFRKTVNTVGRERVILVACLDQDAIDWGHNMGISLFQGSYVTNL